MSTDALVGRSVGIGGKGVSCVEEVGGGVVAGALGTVVAVGGDWSVLVAVTWPPPELLDLSSVSHEVSATAKGRRNTISFLFNPCLRAEPRGSTNRHSAGESSTTLYESMLHCVLVDVITR